MITKPKTVPELRFPGFEGAWGAAALGEIADIKLGKMLDKEKQTTGHLLPYLNNISLRWNEVDTSKLPRMYFRDNELDRFGLRAGDVVVCEGGEPGRSALWDGRLPDLKFQKAIHRVRFNVPFEQRLLVLYLEKIAGTTKFEMLFTGGGIKHLTRETFSLLQIPMISLPEQRKIADFLTAVDGRIGQLSQKKALLEDYKKGVMQQLFTQALRFKDDHGNDFPEWEEKTLGEVTTFINGRAYKQNELLKEGPYPVLRVGNFFTNPEWYYSDLELPEDKYCDTGDLLYAWSASFGPRIWSGGKVIYHYHIWKVMPSKKIAKLFLFHLLDWDVERIKNAQGNGIAMMHVTKQAMEQRPFSLPHPAEQTKIANFLTALDRKIESVSSQITGMQTWKKGLLQQMFV